MARTFLWEEFLAEVAKRVPPQQFKAWMGSVKFLELNDRWLVISSPNPFIRDWINEQYRTMFCSILRDSYGLELDLKVIIDEGQDPTQDPDSPSENPTAITPAPDKNELPLFAFKPGVTQKDKDAEEQFSSEEQALSDARRNRTQDLQGQYGENTDESQQSLAAALSVRDMAAPIIRTLGQPLNPKHTFDIFVVGASNQFAHAAARAVAEQPASQYNPLFLYSDAGLGKTHLLHAIGNYVLRLNPKAKICYISAEKFVNDLIDSIHHGKMSMFREKYRDSYDMLLMDDIQFIAGKDRTQEEFFHTFNALHSSRRQIVVTSDKFPKDIAGLEDRIRTRFEWGLIADIQPPEIETRIAILRAKAEIDDVFLPHDVALFLASNIKSNIRELEGALIRLGAQASLAGSEISLDLAHQLLKNLIKEPSSSVSADLIQEAVARHFSIKVTDLKSRERSRRVSLPRQIAMYLIRKYCDKSYPDIGILMGGKDHSTVLHGVKTISDDIEKDKEVRRHVEEIQNSL